MLWLSNNKLRERFDVDDFNRQIFLGEYQPLQIPAHYDAMLVDGRRQFMRWYKIGEFSC
jgi:hypothetical protein